MAAEPISRAEPNAAAAAIVETRIVSSIFVFDDRQRRSVPLVARLFRQRQPAGVPDCREKSWQMAGSVLDYRVRLLTEEAVVNTLEETIMAWTTPVLTEVCVGMEVTSYASAVI